MNDKKPTVVFFGSGPVAAASLTLLGNWCNIEAVVTKPQPTHHKEQFPVLAVAEAADYPILTARTKLELDQLIAATHFNSDVAVLIDYGIIVSQYVIDTFRLGIINSHFSLLPEWRGADPISFSVLSGQKQTGISLMLLVQKMDEGSLLAQATYDMPDDVSTPDLTTDLIELSDHSLQAILPLYLEGNACPVAQRLCALPGHEVPSYSRKLTKHDGVLDFTKPATNLEREIRAYAEWPKSRTKLGTKDVIITKAHVETSLETRSEPQGKPFVTSDGKVGVLCDQGVLVIDMLKPAGKQEMTSQAFLAGNSIN